MGRTTSTTRRWAVVGAVTTSCLAMFVAIDALVVRRGVELVNAREERLRDELEARAQLRGRPFTWQEMPHGLREWLGVALLDGLRLLVLISLALLLVHAGQRLLALALPVVVTWQSVVGGPVLDELRLGRHAPTGLGSGWLWWVTLDASDKQLAPPVAVAWVGGVIDLSLAVLPVLVLVLLMRREPRRVARLPFGQVVRRAAVPAAAVAVVGAYQLVGPGAYADWPLIGMLLLVAIGAALAASTLPRVGMLSGLLLAAACAPQLGESLQTTVLYAPSRFLPDVLVSQFWASLALAGAGAAAVLWRRDFVTRARKSLQDGRAWLAHVTGSPAVDAP